MNGHELAEALLGDKNMIQVDDKNMSIDVSNAQMESYRTSLTGRTTPPRKFSSQADKVNSLMSPSKDDLFVYYEYLS